MEICSGRIEPGRHFEQRYWFKGPSFLYKPEFCWPKFPLNLTVNNDCELVQSVHATSDSKVNPTEQLLSSSSNWYDLKCKVASYIRLKDYLKTKQMCENVFSIKELNYAETCIWKFLQQKYFEVEYGILSSNKTLPKKHYLVKLAPYVYDVGLIRLGGRLQRSNLTYATKRPILLPKDSAVTRMLVVSLHKTIGHLGHEALRPRYTRVFLTRVSRLFGQSSLKQPVLVKTRAT